MGIELSYFENVYLASDDDLKAYNEAQSESMRRRS